MEEGVTGDLADEHTLLRDNYIKVVSKAWGAEMWVVNNEDYCLKFLVLSPGGCSSLHYHQRKRETFFLQGGTCFLQIGGQVHEMKRPYSVTLEPGTHHRFWKPVTGNPESDKTCVIIEASTHHDDADVVRIIESKRLSPGENP